MTKNTTYFAATVCFTVILASPLLGELNTLSYVSSNGQGQGRLDLDNTSRPVITPSVTPRPVDVSSASKITLLDSEGGDFWNGGDQFVYLYDSNKVTGDFTATARVVGQTESIDGRWGKTGVTATANLSGLAQSAMAGVASGTGSQADPPSSGDHSPIPVRMFGRFANDGTNGFEIPVLDTNGSPIPNNVFATPQSGILDPPTNAAWLRLQYKSDTNTFVAGYSPDRDGAPTEWSYTEDVTELLPPPNDEGWYVGLAYSAQSSFDFGDVQDSDSLHGVTFDNYSIVDEFLLKEVSVAGDAIGTLTVPSNRSDIALDAPQLEQGLAQFWYEGVMRSDPAAFLEAGDTGSSERPLLNPGGIPFANPTTWWRGAQDNPITRFELPRYPPELVGTRFENSTDEDAYSVRLTGEIFIPENGEYLLRDGIDDFAMIAIDADGNGILDDVDNITAANVGRIEGASLGDVHVLDDNSSTLNGGNQSFQFHGVVEVENISAAGDWRKIEIWMSESGGTDGAVIYMGNLDDPDIFDDLNTSPLTQEERDRYIIPPENLRSQVPVILQGDAEAKLPSDTNYIMQVTSDGSDMIAVDKNNAVSSLLDLSEATITIEILTELSGGETFQLFDVDVLIGTESMSLRFDDPHDWDLTRLSEGVISYGGGCNPNTLGDIDGDGTVQLSDFLILSEHFGREVMGHRQGDIDCDGVVQLSDFLILAGNFGTSVVDARAVGVPEPSGLVIIAFVALLSGLRQRRIAH